MPRNRIIRDGWSIIIDFSGFSIYSGRSAIMGIDVLPFGFRDGYETDTIDAAFWATPLLPHCDAPTGAWRNGGFRGFLSFDGGGNLSSSTSDYYMRGHLPWLMDIMKPEDVGRVGVVR